MDSEIRNKKKPSGTYKSASLHRRNKRKRKGFMGKKQVDDVDITVATTCETTSEIEVDDLQAVDDVGYAADVLRSDAVRVNMSDDTKTSVYSGNTLFIDEPIPSTSKAISSSVLVSVVAVNKYKKYRDLVNRSKEKLNTGSFLMKSGKMLTAKTRLQKTKTGATKKKVGVNSAEGYKLIDVKLLENLLGKCCICRLCKRKMGKIEILEDTVAGKGLCEKLIFKCRNCRYEMNTFTSNKTGSKISPFDVNVRSTYGSLPFGREGLAKFCVTMDLPPPIHGKSYSKILQNLKVKSEKAADDVMKEAASRLITLCSPEDIEIDSNGVLIARVTVTLDGTWQKRGHSSKHGVVYILSVDSGEVLDYCVKTLHCHKCVKHQNDNKTSLKYKEWYKGHIPNCTINYVGSSGGMEAEAGVEMFLRSIKNRNLKYTTFVGDGDSSCYSKVRDACATHEEAYYVVKEECTGHVQKRMGGGLRELKRKRRQKLSDGKGLSGAGRLTEVMIDQVQHNYGEAIQSHSDINSMKKAINAIFHHMIKDDTLSLVQQHIYCPKHNKTWCIFWLDKLHDIGIYNDDSRLPAVFKEELKPLFSRLSNPELLQQCCRGLTQNQNEAINNVLWSMCSKRTFCGYTTLALCVSESILKFNCGSSSRIAILDEMKCHVGFNMKSAIEREDALRVHHADRKISLERRSQRQSQRLKRKLSSSTKKDYMPGGFDLITSHRKRIVEIKFVNEDIAKEKINGFYIF